MDDNIIEFKPRIKEKTSDDIMDDAEVNPPKTRDEFLALCKKVLEPEDYKDFLCSIMDVEMYKEADLDIQKVVEKYFSFNR